MMSPMEPQMSRHATHRLPTSTADLLDALHRGDPSAWTELVARYATTVRSAVATFRLQESDAADVAQNTWLRLFLHATTIRDPERVGAWLATTARREALALLRRNRLEIVSESAGEATPAPEPSPEDAVVVAETRAAAAELTGRRKLLVEVLFFEQPPSYVEVSRRTGLPVGSIGPTRGRTLRELRRKLSEPEADEGLRSPEPKVA